MTTFQYLPWFDQHLHLMMQHFDQGTFPQSLMIIGEKDIGKSIYANDLAKNILCLNRMGDKACGVCQSCIWIDKKSHPDFLPIISEEKSTVIKVDQIRALIQFAQMTSETGRKVIVIHNADEMNLNAANALLKTLEEPFANCYLILVTSYPKQLPITITSRCQRQLMTIDGQKELIVEWLRQVVLLNDPVLLQQLLLLSYGRPLLSYRFFKDDILNINHELDKLFVRYLHHKNNLDELSDFIVKNWQFSSHLILLWLVSVLKGDAEFNVATQTLSLKPLISIYESYESFIKILELSATNVKQEWLVQDWLLKL